MVGDQLLKYFLLSQRIIRFYFIFIFIFFGEPATLGLFYCKTCPMPTLTDASVAHTCYNLFVLQFFLI